MLKFATGSEFSYPTSGRRWVVTSSDLRARGLRSPQGFSFAFGNENTDNFFWTSDEFAAYLFHRRYGWSAPEVGEYFTTRRAKEEYLYKLSSATTSKLSFRSPANYAYRPHQAAGIEYCLNTGNVLIADEQRLGKTAIAIGVINNLPDVNKVLVLCPKTAKIGWYEELQRWLIHPRDIQVLNAQSVVNPRASIYIANYDILHILTDLLDEKFDIVIPDECHLVSRMEARRTKFFLAIKAKKIIGLSGTPLLNNPKDLLTIAAWLDPFWKQFSHSKGKFISQSGIGITLEEAQDIMRSNMMLRRLQAQVFECEPVETRVVPIAPTKIVQPFVEMELRKLEDYAKVRRILGLHKVPYALNHINVYSSEGEKIVVFAHHRQVIDRLATSLGSKSVVIYGESTDKERELAKRRFNTDPSCQILIGSIAAASMALNLSVANHIIFVECDWSNGLMEQAKERCSDQLQEKPVIIEYLVFANSLDYYILNKVDYKNKIADRGLDTVYE